MSYLVMARKWRPQTFADLVGQEHVSRTLANAIASGRVHHAFLFTGARGVGKTSAARILAKALNCENGPSAEPCNQCQHCEEISSGHSVDVFEIDGASNTGVDDVRELRETLRYMPSQCRYKIFIIDEVHMLSINAFNALLKTLEEPPEHVKFIFATTEPHKIPVTILSRCQRFDFRKIPAPKVVAQLRRIVDAENITISDRALALIAQRGGGSMRDSLSTLDQVVAFCSEQVADEDVQGLLGMVDRRLLFDALEGCMRQDCSMVLNVVRRVDDLGHSFRQFCQELVETVRQAILCSLVENPEEDLGVFGDELHALKSLSALAGQDDWQRLLSMLIKVETELSASSFPRLLVEMTLVRAASLPPAKDIAGLIRKVEALEGGYSSGSVPRPQPQQAPPVSAMMPKESPPAPAPPSATAPQSAPSPVSAPSVSAAEEPQPAAPVVAEAPAPVADPPSVAAPQGGAAPSDWSQLVAQVRGKSPSLASLLEYGSLMKMALPELVIGYPPSSFHLQQMNDAESRDRLTQLVRELYGLELDLKIQALTNDASGPPSLVETKKKKESDRERRLREDALTHPTVKKAIEIFSGDIESVTPIDKGFV
ncbi:DNA polymerase III subunit gamma/tau [Desulfuromonas acetoxidans]|uniref:DNA polymerase III subunit gamma/tau n=1 Tax=Desulfuromonas acetoxidans TaxID=891 RepID=UPI002930931A|nr:DNA polymerase III subunit gamma/tau [Desulfuromonas acetoxidans]